MPTVKFTRQTRTITDIGPVLIGVTTLDGRTVAAVVTKHALDDYAWSIAGDLRDTGIRGYRSEASAAGGLMDGLDRLLAGGRRMFGWTEGTRAPTRAEVLAEPDAGDGWPGNGPDEWRDHDDPPKDGTTPEDRERWANYAPTNTTTLSRYNTEAEVAAHAHVRIDDVIARLDAMMAPRDPGRQEHRRTRLVCRLGLHRPAPTIPGGELRCPSCGDEL